ncbi:lysozyme [Acinetobacter nosocomialis]|uniref:Lysozyme n=1 Tax=Acinetobacter nosocomialis TaxID=106654 RepID=A0A2L1VEA6_ACINO|nr:lysozyme [Acinetobacter nosocomialis]AVF43592.1 muraminidase [Acinetobacter nosocomialis]
MKISATGINLIKSFEGLRLKAYDDGVGVWTIGFGTIKYPNGIRVKGGDSCTSQQAEYYLLNDLTSFENAVNRLVKAKLTQNQFDALVSFTYNLGEANLGKSTLLKKLNAGDYQGAADQFLVWNKAGGKVMKGLVRRREAERALFLKK